MATRIGPGHRTMAAPILRHPRTRIVRFGSNSPNRLAATTMALPAVSAVITTTLIPIANGTPMVWK